jgi:hypothetical protein
MNPAKQTDDFGHGMQTWGFSPKCAWWGSHILLLVVIGVAITYVDIWLCGPAVPQFIRYVHYHPYIYRTLIACNAWLLGCGFVISSSVIFCSSLWIGPIAPRAALFRRLAKLHFCLGIACLAYPFVRWMLIPESGYEDPLWYLLMNCLYFGIFTFGIADFNLREAQRLKDEDPEHSGFKLKAAIYFLLGFILLAVPGLLSS